MSFLDRIAECNNADFGCFLPFRVGGAHVGWVAPGFARVLRRFPAVFAASGGAVSLKPALDTPARRSKAIACVLHQLAAEGLVWGWRDETYPVVPFSGGLPLMTMERAAVPHFGVRAFGVHLNGFVRRRDGIHMWIGRRSRDKHTYPGMLDNMVAGGQPVGISLRENLIKECREEAGIPRKLAARAIPVGAITYAYEGKTEGGLKPDVQYCYDLELPAAFIPRNADGEIAEFMLWPIEKVARVVRDTTRFKFNCNLCIIDFLVRHGLIGPEHPDYVAICKGLRR
jgi:isopentenyldiphosphate isomerase